MTCARSPRTATTRDRGGVQMLAKPRADLLQQLDLVGRGLADAEDRDELVDERIGVPHGAGPRPRPDAPSAHGPRRRTGRARRGRCAARASRPRLARHASRRRQAPSRDPTARARSAARSSPDARGAASCASGDRRPPSRAAPPRRAAGARAWRAADRGRRARARSPRRDRAPPRSDRRRRGGRRRSPQATAARVPASPAAVSAERLVTSDIARLRSPRPTAMRDGEQPCGECAAVVHVGRRRQQPPRRRRTRRARTRRARAASDAAATRSGSASARAAASAAPSTLSASSSRARSIHASPLRIAKSTQRRLLAGARPRSRGRRRSPPARRASGRAAAERPASASAPPAASLQAPRRARPPITWRSCRIPGAWRPRARCRRSRCPSCGEASPARPAPATRTATAGASNVLLERFVAAVDRRLLGDARQRFDRRHVPRRRPRRRPTPATAAARTGPGRPCARSAARRTACSRRPLDALRPDRRDQRVDRETADADAARPIDTRPRRPAAARAAADPRPRRSETPATTARPRSSAMTNRLRPRHSSA